MNLEEAEVLKEKLFFLIRKNIKRYPIDDLIIAPTDPQYLQKYIQGKLIGKSTKRLMLENGNRDMTIFITNLALYNAKGVLISEHYDKYFTKKGMEIPK